MKKSCYKYFFNNYEVNLQQRTEKYILETINIQRISQYVFSFWFLRLENAKKQNDKINLKKKP